MRSCDCTGEGIRIVYAAEVKFKLAKNPSLLARAWHDLCTCCLVFVSVISIGVFAY